MLLSMFSEVLDRLVLLERTVQNEWETWHTRQEVEPIDGYNIAVHSPANWTLVSTLETVAARPNLVPSEFRLFRVAGGWVVVNSILSEGHPTVGHRLIATNVSLFELYTTVQASGFTKDHDYVVWLRTALMNLFCDDVPNEAEERVLFALTGIATYQPLADRTVPTL